MVSASPGDLPIVAPSAEEVREQLERILSSDKLHLPDRGKSFVRFVVDETLAGRREFLKAFTIAQEVFGRRETFDAQNDPVVRIEAGRIRRELERYYLLSGPSERVIITIPKGGYVPVFEFNPTFNEDAGQSRETVLEQVVRETLPLSENKAGAVRRVPAGHLPKGVLAAGVAGVVISAMLLIPQRNGQNVTPTETAYTRPIVAVERFRDAASSDRTSGISQGLTDEIIGNLVKFKDIVVVEGTSSAEPSHAGSGYVLQGSVRLDGEKIRSIARLVRRADGVIIWANNYDSDLRAQSAFEIERTLAQNIATAVAQPFGVMFQTDTGSVMSIASEGWDTYTCATAYYSYRREMTLKSHDFAKHCLEQASAKQPTDAAAQAYLSLLFLDEVRFSYKLGVKPSPSSLETAFELAKHAVELDPQNSRALQALMLAYVFRNDIQSALRAGAAAYAINPNDTEVAGEYGLRLAMSGNWETGCGFISNALSNGAGPEGYFEVGMALCAFIGGDLGAAELWSRMSDLDYNPMHHIVLTAILGASGKLAEAKTHLNWINAHAPALMPNVVREISMRIARQDDRNRILAGLREAGVDIPTATN